MVSDVEFRGVCRVSAATWARTSMTFQEYRQARTFPALDGLRAVAASMVVVFHFGGPRLAFVQGWIGVHVFFALSGFLITTLALREVDRAGRLDLSAFYLRRIFRIVPVYLVVLALLVAQTELTGAGRAKMHAALPYYLTFLNELAPSAAYVQSWTLGIEQKFYLVWPLLAFGVAWRARGRAGAAIGAIVVLLALWNVPWVSSVHYTVLLLGSLLAIVLHQPRGFALVRPLLTPVGSVAAVVAFLAFHLQLRGLLARFGEPPVIVMYGLAVCVLLPAVLGPGPVRWLLSLRPMAFVGQRSYSVYLVQSLAHSAALGLAGTVAANKTPTAALITWIVAVLFADLLYRWIEQPMIAVGKRVSRRRSRSTVTTTDEPASRPIASPIASPIAGPVGSAAGSPAAARVAGAGASGARP